MIASLPHMHASSFSKVRWILFTFIILLLIFVGIGIGKIVFPSDATDPALQPLHIDAVQEVNKTFTFPVNNSQGQMVTNISYTITSVDKQNQVIIKNQRARAVAGRTFLIIDLKLTNTSSQTIQLNSRDYIRVSSGKSNELYAADMYNDPIIIQPISTEYTQLGIPIDTKENVFTLHVGQLNGSKTDIPIHL